MLERVCDMSEDESRRRYGDRALEMLGYISTIITECALDGQHDNAVERYILG